MDAPDITRGGITQNEENAESIGRSDSAVDFPTTQPLDAIPTHPPAGKPLTPERARALTDAIRCDMSAVWMQLLRAYEGNAHGALGYANWADYCHAEFGIERSRAYRTLNAARVVGLVADIARSPIGNSVQTPPIRESVARELAPLLNEPEALVSTFEEAAAEAPKAADGSPKVTAALVREKVRAKVGESSQAMPKSRGVHRLADRPVENGSRVSPTAPVTTTHPTTSPPTLVEAVRRVTAAVSADAPRADITEAVSVALRLRSEGNSLPGSAVLTELVGELLLAVRALAKEAA